MCFSLSCEINTPDTNIISISHNSVQFYQQGHIMLKHTRSATIGKRYKWLNYSLDVSL